MKRVGAAMLWVLLGMVTACAAESATNPAGGESPYAEGRVIVRLKGALSAEERRECLKALGLTPVRRLEGIDADLVGIPAGEGVSQAVERLRKAPAVEYVEPDFRVRTR